MRALRANAGLWILVLAVGLCVATRVEAQRPSAPGNRSIHFERLEGLSHNTVFAVLQDRQGFLWIGTADGLNRYDGYEMTVYRHDPTDSTSLSDNTITALAEGEDGDLWVGTSSDLNRWDRATGQFVRPGVRPDSLDRPLDIEALASDSTGALWIRTAERELYRYDRKARDLVPYPRAPEANPNWAEGEIGAVSVGPGGTLWVSTRSGSPGDKVHLALHRHDAGRDRFRQVSLPGRHRADVYLPQLHAGPSGALWVGLYNQRARIDTVAGPLRSIPELPEGTEVHQLLEARDGTLWIGVEEGVYRYDPAAKTLRHHRIEDARTTWLSNNVQDLYEDRSGTV